MKRTILLLLILSVLGFFFSYLKADLEQKAEALFWAAYEGNLAEVKDAVEKGVSTQWTLQVTDPAKKYHETWLTTFQAAASSGNHKILQYLLQNTQQDINQVNDKNWTALFVAVRDGHAEYAAQLVRAEADPNIQTDTGATPLILAFLTDFSTAQQRLSLIEYLLKRGANPHILSDFGTDALFYAVTQTKDPAAVELLLKYGVSVCRKYEEKELREWTQDKKIRSLLEEAYQKQCRD
ncbi:MAG: ankyrin repeat domain-containing protein [Elusimicrobiaceae bacterium]|nr:ankyrin repeat domain-containing protein [Elusimicrobiaceae bacterium]MBR3899304.1 ankyrin repeat domain-containing protein [Elusimicrobiaceae bacterium]